MKRGFEFSENFSYKIVALFIALILWLTIHGRRDFERVISVPVQIQPASGLQLKDDPIPSIEIKVIGNRRGLKEVDERVTKKPLIYEVSRVGFSRVSVRRGDIHLPADVRLVWIRPESIEVRARSAKTEERQ